MRNKDGENKKCIYSGTHISVPVLDAIILVGIVAMIAIVVAFSM